MEPVKYQLSKREFVIDGFLYCLRSQPYILIFLISLAATLMGFLFWNLASVIFIIISASITIIIPLWLLWVCLMTVKNYPEWFNEIFIQLDEIGITTITIAYKNTYYWNALKKWSENRKHIFIYISKQRNLFIPKRAFTNEQLMEFKTLLSEKIRPS